MGGAENTGDFGGEATHAVAFVADVKRLGEVKVAAGAGESQSSQKDGDGDLRRKEKKTMALAEETGA
ncbi:MAG: hypothetical protein UY33_C0032G0022 [Candidatus Amesbacteria bacterium GW2011_GWA1_48_9]|uniref:Uncharacterized protein n=1 Tax=Candidatus Amesbacteria bacterium GW2011_GWA1_48_9 TaxID=1618355 RepID=A0A0G1XA04_9BACT|nr:MAG: hypothetical protein UY33_C0032G0022 [Candidatus Amesbacteria bacterium GW2011_GWA1_48_9]